MDMLPTPNMGQVNSKVTAGAVYGAVSGGVLTTAVIQIVEKGFGVSPDWFTPEVVIVLTSVIGGVATFVCGWLKKHGIEV